MGVDLTGAGLGSGGLKIIGSLGVVLEISSNLACLSLAGPGSAGLGWELFFSLGAGCSGAGFSGPGLGVVGIDLEILGSVGVLLEINSNLACFSLAGPGSGGLGLELFPNPWVGVSGAWVGVDLEL